MSNNAEQLSAIALDTALKIHRDLGPGLLESVYEVILAGQLERKGLQVERQKAIDISYDGLSFPAAFRADIVIERRLVIEVKSVETLAKTHAKQLLTYLKLMHLPLGLLINFGGATLKEGVRRLVNDHTDFASSRLRANQ